MVSRYSSDQETYMRRFFSNLNERDRRHYAALEAIRLGHGGIEYISAVLSIDPKTIRTGIPELKKTTLSGDESGDSAGGANR